MLFREHPPPQKIKEKNVNLFSGHLQKEGGWPCTNMLALLPASISWQFGNILLVLLVLVLIDCLLMCRVMFQLGVLWYVVTSLNKDTNLVPILCPTNKVFHSCHYSSIPTLVVVLCVLTVLNLKLSTPNHTPYTLRTDSYSHLQLDDFLHWISTGFRPRFVPDGDLDNIGTLPVASFAVVPAMELCSQQEDQEEICRAGHVSHNSNMSLKNFKGGNKSLFIRCLCK